MTTEAEILMSVVRVAPREALPGLIGELAEIQAIALSRLTAPAPVASRPDELLAVDEASRRIGVSPSYLYKNHAKFAFTRHIGRRLLFSSNGLERYIRSRP